MRGIFFKGVRPLFKISCLKKGSDPFEKKHLKPGIRLAFLLPAFIAEYKK